MVADDDQSGERRTFRVDRIDDVVLTGRVDPTDEVVGTPGAFFGDHDLPRAVVRLAPAAQWVLDRYPVRSQTPVAGMDGWVEAELSVASDRWFARLLIRLGPDVVVVSPADAGADAATLAAAMLARY